MLLSVIFYIFAVILLAAAVVALLACHQNISLQLEQGVPVEGNELAIVNLYLSSCMQYFALAATMIFCGYALRKFAAFKPELPLDDTHLLNAPADVNEPVDVDDSAQEEEDIDFDKWDVDSEIVETCARLAFQYLQAVGYDVQYSGKSSRKVISVQIPESKRRERIGTSGNHSPDQRELRTGEGEGSGGFQPGAYAADTV